MTAPTLADLRPGDIGFGPIGGIAGVGVRAGELLVAPFDHWPTWRSWRKVAHCGTVTEAAVMLTDATTLKTFMHSGPRFAQAEPGGYQEITLGAQHWTSDWVFMRPHYAPLTAGPFSVPGQSQADEVALIAKRMVSADIPYGFEDYAAIAAHRAGLHVKPVDNFIARVDQWGLPRRAICSQGVDAQLTLSGGLLDGHVFNDGRLSQDVTPSELYLRLLDIGLLMVFRPGVA